MLQRHRRNFSYYSVVLLRKEFRSYLGNILIVGLNETKTKAIVNHIQQMARYFHEYSANDDSCMFDCIRNPFVCFQEAHKRISGHV